MVLIISILSAIALPQYRLAVAKSHVAAVMPVLMNIKKAEKVYYLANGEYTYFPSHLGIGIPKWGNTNPTNGMINDHFSINFGSTYATGYYCPHAGINGYSSCGEQPEFRYRINFQDDSNQIVCKGYTDLGRKLCVMFQ